MKLKMPERFFKPLYDLNAKSNCFFMAIVDKIPFQEDDNIEEYYSTLINEFLKYSLSHLLVERNMMRELNIEKYDKSIMFDVYLDEKDCRPFNDNLSEAEFLKEKSLLLLYNLKNKKPRDNFNSDSEREFFENFIQELAKDIESNNSIFS